MEKEPFNLLNYLRFLNKWKWWILFPAVLAASVTLVIGLSSPRPYTAEASILLSMGGGMTLNPIPGLGLGDFSVGNPNISIVSQMIRSRKMAEDVVDHFKLTEKGYGTNRALVVIKVKGMITTREMQSGLIIRVTTTDPELSSDIANFCVKNLNVMNEELGITTEKPVAKFLDPAIPPIFPSSRKVIPRVVLAFLVWMTGSIVFIFFREYSRELRQREETAQMLSAEMSDKNKEQIFS